MFDEEHVIYRYKYLPFTDDSIKIITEGTIKFTCPLEFNDPFDCCPYYDTSRIEDLPRTRPDLFKKAGKLRGLSPAKRLQQRGKFVARIRNKIESGEMLNGMINNVGVVCLSKNGTNILMWSHYADFHRGIVLEFRIPIMGYKQDVALATDRLLPIPVTYSCDRPHINIGQEDTKDLLNKLLLAKSLDWAYEEEERVIDRERQPGIYRYRRDDILCSVIAGMKMNDDNFVKLTSIVADLANGTLPHLRLYRAKAKEDQFRLYVDGHPRLDYSSNNG